MPSFFRTPVPIIEIIHDGFYCKICYDDASRENYACGSESTYNDHFRSNHPEYFRQNKDFRRTSPVQRLFNFRGRCLYFTVKPSLGDPLPSEESPFDLLTKNVRDARPPPDQRKCTVPKDVRVLSAFLYETGWANAVDGMNPYTLSGLVAMPEQFHHLHGLALAVRGFYRYASEYVTPLFNRFNLRLIAAKDEWVVLFLLLQRSTYVVLVK